MSVRLDAVAERVFRTATVPSSGSFSAMWWAYRVANTGDNESMFMYYESLGGTYLAVYMNGSQIPTVINSTFVGGNSSAGAWTTGSWRRFAMVFDDSGNTLTLYEGDADPTTAMSQTAQVTETATYTPDQIMFGGAIGFIGGISGRVGNLKLYTAVLSAASLKTELQYFNIQSATNIWGAWDLKAHTVLTDNSGNSRTLSANGTISTEADPPITDSPIIVGGVANIISPRISRPRPFAPGLAR